MSELATYITEVIKCDRCRAVFQLPFNHNLDPAFTAVRVPDAAGLIVAGRFTEQRDGNGASHFATVIGPFFAHAFCPGHSVRLVVIDSAGEFDFLLSDGLCEELGD